jgi:hypothetical protein
MLHNYPAGDEVLKVFDAPYLADRNKHLERFARFPGRFSS